MQPNPVIELQDAAISAAHAPGVVAVENVNWTIRAGEFWAVGGPPGCGKSSLLATAAGLARPAEGACRLFGRDMAELHGDDLARERLRIGLVFPNEGRLFQELTVAGNVALPLAYHRDITPTETEERVAAILNRLELGQMANLFPVKLSSPLRARTALARALALEPEVLFLDDPLRGLDRRETRWWRDFLSGLNEGDTRLSGKRMTLAVTTSDLAAWAERAGNFALIHSRQWVFLGGQDELKARSEPHLRELLASEAE